MAQQRGIAEATSAIAAAQSLGLGSTGVGSIVYYDLEQYSLGKCDAAVEAFLSGWRSQLNNNLYLDGVYGTPADAESDWSVAAYSPDNVWIAKWGTNNINSPNITVWGLTPLEDDFWNTNPPSRIHQYLGNKSVTFGLVAPIIIDFDIEDGPIIVSTLNNAQDHSHIALDGIRNYNWTLTSLGLFPGSCQTRGEGINDEGQIVGIWWTSGPTGICGIHGWAFLYSGGAFTSLIPPGASYSNAAAINDDGSVVGSYLLNNVVYGFLYQGGLFTTLAYPGANYTEAIAINDDGAIVGNWSDSVSEYGFLYQNGQYTSISYPGAPETLLGGINGQGIVTGSYVPFSFANTWWGFAYNDGNFSGPFLYSGSNATETQFNGINNNGQVMGNYYNGTYGYFIYDINTDTVVQTIQPYDFTAMNDQGQWVGEDSNYNLLLATPQ